MYVNGKVIPVETIPGIEKGGIKENDEWGEFKLMYLIYYMNFSKCHDISHPPQQ
jgi:hypothetical protein